MRSIRPAHEADIPALADLNTDLFREDSGRHDPTINLDWPGRRTYFEELIADGARNVAWLAEDHDQAIGYFVGRIRAADDFRTVTSAALEHLYVAPEYRNGGVGTALAQAFFTWAREQNATRATVTAYTDNADAIRFYQRIGFDQRSTTLDRRLP